MIVIFIFIKIIASTRIIIVTIAYSHLNTLKLRVRSKSYDLAMSNLLNPQVPSLNATPTLLKR